MSITRVTRDRREGRPAPGAGQGAGLGLALASAAAFGTSGTFADSLMLTGWSPGAVVTFRVTLAAVLLTIPAALALRGRWGQLRRALPAATVFGVVAVAGCQLFYFNAVERLAVGVALLLEYLGILLVVVWMWVRHGNTPRRRTVLGGAAALLGLVLVLQPPAGGIDPVGVFWGLLAACGLAVYFVLSSRSGADVPPIALAWAAMVIGALTLIVLDLLGVLDFRTSARDVDLVHTRVSWIVPVVGLALVAAAFAYASGIAAARLLGAKLASFIGLTEVLFAVLIAWVVLGQSLGTVQLLGGLAVLAGITLVRADETAGAGAAVDPAIGAGAPTPVVRT